MKQQQAINKLELERQAILCLHDGKYAKVVQRLLTVQKKLSTKRAIWQSKLDKLNDELLVTTDRVYNEKKKRRDAIGQQVDKARSKETEMQNYIEGLNKMNFELADEVKEAIKQKRAALDSSAKA